MNRTHTQNQHWQHPGLMDMTNSGPVPPPSVVFVDRGHHGNISRYNTSFYQGNGPMEGVPRPSYFLQ